MNRKTKFKSVKKCLLALAISSMAISCTIPAKKESANQEREIVSVVKKETKTLKLTILHTNDHHGHFWTNKYGEGGLAAQKTLIDKIRKEVVENGGKLLVLSAGDVNTGVPESDLQDAEPDFKGMSKAGYNAMAVGNHEFDKPLEIIRKQEKWASFPFLSANIYEKSTNKRLFKPYIKFDLNGVKVAVLGLTTEDTAYLGNPEYLGEIEFRSPIKEAAKLVPGLKKESDMLIGLTHMGYYKDAKHGGNAAGDVSLVRQVKGFHLIVGGHSHDKLDKPVIENGAYITQALESSKYMGRLDGEFKDGKFKVTKYRMVSINLKKKIKKDGKKVRVLIEEQILEDKEMLTLLKPYQEKGNAELGKVIGSTDGKFVGDRDIVRFKETNLGNLIAVSMMKKANADLAVMNSGGIRTSISEGDISYKDVLLVQPFANTICTVDMKGSELIDYLQVVGNKKIDSGAFAQFAGVKLMFDGEKLVGVKVAGQPLDMEKSYRLAILSYAAAGGDGYPVVNNHPNFVNTGYVDADVLREYISKNSPLKIADYAPTNDVIRE